MKKYIGMDVHSNQIVYVAMEKNGKVIGRGRVGTSLSGLEEMLRKTRCGKGTDVGLESGSQAFLVARWLLQLGVNPLVINAQEVRAKARRRNQKTDSRDAWEICDGIRRDIYQSMVYVPTPQVQRLRVILSRHMHFTKISTMQINAARFLLRSEGITFGSSLNTKVAWQKLLENEMVQAVKIYIQMHAEVWESAQRQLNKLKMELQQALLPFKREVKLLMSVPGIGRLTAAAYVGVVGDPHRFEDAGKLASYLGIVPSTYDSGGRQRHGHITRNGSPMMRSLLCEAAHSAGRVSNPLNPYWRRLMATKGYRKAVTAVSHRMARIMYHMWIKGEKFDIDKLNVELRPTQRTTTVLYQLKRAS